jgi:hypothetical protein
VCPLILTALLIFVVIYSIVFQNASVTEVAVDAFRPDAQVHITEPMPASVFVGPSRLRAAQIAEPPVYSLRAPILKAHIFNGIAARPHGGLIPCVAH